MHRVCEAVGSKEDGTEFIERCRWFAYARKNVTPANEIPVIDETTHGLQAFSFQVEKNSTPIHFERRGDRNQVLNRFLCDCDFITQLTETWTETKCFPGCIHRNVV